MSAARGPRTVHRTDAIVLALDCLLRRVLTQPAGSGGRHDAALAEDLRALADAFAMEGALDAERAADTLMQNFTLSRDWPLSETQRAIIARAVAVFAADDVDTAAARQALNAYLRAYEKGPSIGFARASSTPEDAIDDYVFDIRAPIDP